MICRHCRKRPAVFEVTCRECQAEVDRHMAAMGWRPDWERAFALARLIWVPGKKAKPSKGR